MKEPLVFTPRGILQRSGRILWAGRGWAWRAMISVGGVIAFLAALLTMIPPDVDLCWIDGNEGLPVAAPLPAERWMPMDVQDIYRHRVSLPVQIGIRNKSWLPLSNVRVTIEYPELRVLSSARPLAAMDSTVIMEHALGVLMPGPTFTPISDVDRVLVPVDSLLVGALTVDDAGIPQYVEFTRLWPQLKDTSHVLLSVRARVAAEGRFREFVATLTVPMWLEQQSWWPPPLPMRERPSTSSESQLFTMLAQGSGETLFSGAMTTKTRGLRVRWTCVKTPQGRFAIYSVDGDPVRIQADTNLDWMVDFELLRRPGGAGRVTVTYYGGPRPMDMPGVSARLRPELPGEVAPTPSPVRLKS